MSPSHGPRVLIDQPEDGWCEDVGWVEATVPEARARELLAEFCCDERGDSPSKPTGPARRVFMRLSNPKADYEDQRWVLCTARAKTAIEFWEVITG